MVLSLQVKAKIAVELASDISLEFQAIGNTYAEVRQSSEDFIRDYISFHQLEGVQKVEFVYADKDGLIINTIDDIKDIL